MSYWQPERNGAAAKFERTQREESIPKILLLDAGSDWIHRNIFSNRTPHWRYRIPQGRGTTQLPRGSLSAYYHSGIRDLFVGSLCVTAVFLITYKMFEHT